MNEDTIDRIICYLIRGILGVIGMMVIFMLVVFISKYTVLCMLISGFVIFVFGLGWFIQEVIGL